MTFTPYNVSHTISVVIVDDGTLEEREMFVVQFSVHEDKERVEVSGPNNATVTIVDNDSETSVYFSCVL